jgi:hypothetical protein
LLTAVGLEASVVNVPGVAARAGGLLINVSASAAKTAIMRTPARSESGCRETSM